MNQGDFYDERGVVIPKLHTGVLEKDPKKSRSSEFEN